LPDPEWSLRVYLAKKIIRVEELKNNEKQSTNLLRKAKKVLDGGGVNEAAEICEKIIAGDQGHQEASLMLATCCNRLCDYQRAISCIESYAKSSSSNPEVYFELGLAYQGLGDSQMAMKAFRQCLSMSPGHEAGLKFAGLLRKFGFAGDAIGLYGSIQGHHKHNPNYFLGLGLALCNVGEISQAISMYKKGLVLEANHRGLRSNLLLASHYMSGVSPQALFETHKKLASGTNEAAQECTRYEHEKVRVGYLSPNLHAHSVTDFLEPLIQNHDKSKFEIYFYSNNERIDHITERLRSTSDQWRQTQALTSIELAHQIKKDEIDILIDLAGHSGGNRLDVMEHRPAPVQATWLGYPNTTGMSQVDFRLSDVVADPEGVADTLHTEKLIRLPNGFLCYRCDEDVVRGAESSNDTAKPITFGCFNVLSKITPEVISVWAQILNKIEGSRMLLKSQHFSDTQVKRKYQILFQRNGIDPERIDFTSWVESRREHLEMYNRIDLALDTFPYNGTTTTCEALWMGVPVLTIEGESHVSRVSSSILSRLSLDDLAVDNIDAYVAKAVEIVRNKKMLNELRETITSTIEGSDLCNGKLFASNVEDAYRVMLKNS